MKMSNSCTAEEVPEQKTKLPYMLHVREGTSHGSAAVGFHSSFRVFTSVCLMGRQAFKGVKKNIVF